ncbi:hypothetical protein [Leptolyngbya sp. PCC 6406]|uniref:hypothetical protein n=1 Tax=Leptolyngbya sp. PCC 6406 TaxID=1173264 RepID=UPI0002AC2816|nr:hypothetical protein [Leptolyngbya sp. PCC 6406]
MTIEATITKILESRRITRIDQKTLMIQFSQTTLSTNDRELINQIYEALNQGRLRVVD